MATQAELAELKRAIEELGQKMDQQMVLVQGLVKESPQAYHLPVNGTKLCSKGLFKGLAELHEAQTRPKEVTESSSNASAQKAHPVRKTVLCNCTARKGSTSRSNRRGQPRIFSCLPAPLTSVYEQLRDAGIIGPLTPSPLPKILSARLNPNHFCAFHQTHGHLTDTCYRLRHEIQDLIDNGIIPPPPQSKLDAISNPWPQLKSDPPHDQTSINSTQNNLSSTILNPSHDIAPETQPEPVVSIPSEPEVGIWAMF